MPVSNLVFWLVIDPITFGLGSIGAYILFNELSAFDRFPTWREMVMLIKKRWLALLGLGIAVTYFFYRLSSVILS
jgi:hypothetical protein